MAKARMLHKKISISLQVNSLPLPARLLFTWLIAHADDDGRIIGDPKYIKATVVPMTTWSTKLIQSYLKQMQNTGLIYYWQINNEWFIEFAKWKDYQSIRSDRFESSKLPSFINESDNQLSTKSQPIDDQSTAQENISQSNVIEVNKSEYRKDLADKDIKTNGIASLREIIKHKTTQIEDRQKATKSDNFEKRTPSKTVKNLQFLKEEYPADPNQYKLKDASEVGAKTAWQQLEPNNPRAFYTTYLNAARQGLPPTLFYTFTSEIKQSNTKNPGAVFNIKVKDYFEKKTI